MKHSDVTIAVFSDHLTADAAIKALADSGFEMKNLSVVGQGYHTEEKVVGFYNIGERMAFWGARGATWGGLWGLFLGGLFITTPLVGPVIVLGYIATTIIVGIESAVIVGGLSAFAAALASLGVPKDTVIEYEEAIKTDNFLVMAHGPAEEMARAKSILANHKPSRLDIHASFESANDFMAQTIVHGAI
jgi:hypothetical protein